MIQTMLAWRPFLDPLDLHEYWWAFLIPLSLFISIAYKAVRVPTLNGFALVVMKMTAQIILGMLVLGAAAYLMIGFALPYIMSIGR